MWYMYMNVICMRFLCEYGMCRVCMYEYVLCVCEVFMCGGVCVLCVCEVSVCVRCVYVCLWYVWYVCVCVLCMHVCELSVWFNYCVWCKGGRVVERKGKSSDWTEGHS